MSKTKVLYGLAALLPLFAGVSLAETPKQSNAVAKKPVQLTEQQMDKVSAGWDIRIFELYNSGADWVSVYEVAPGPTTVGGGFFGANNALSCPNTLCYINVQSRGLSVASAIFGGPIGP